MNKQFVHFTLDTDLEAWDNHGPSASFAVQRRFIEHWRKYGILNLLGRRRDLTSLKNMVASMPIESRELWKNALKLNKQFRMVWNNNQVRGHEYSEITNNIGIDLMLNELDIGQLRLICLGDDEKPANIGITDQANTVYIEGLDVELCHMSGVDQSPSFIRADELSQSAIRVGDTLDDIWDQRFIDVAKTCTEVVIVDRYALQEMDHDGEESGLINFLDRLANSLEAATSVNIVIYGAMERPGRSANQIIPPTTTRYFNSLEQLVSTRIGSSFSNISVNIVNRQIMRDWAHDRYIRFDSSVVNLGTGMQVFESPSITRRCTYSLHVKSKSEAELESKLSNNLLDSMNITDEAVELAS